MGQRLSESRYLHGTEPDEQARLSRLNDLLNARCLEELAIRPGDKVLDVGSGLGQLTRGIARAGASHVLGIERSEAQIAEALRQAAKVGEEGLVELRLGDAGRLPLRDDEWSTFDVAHTRFVLEHVPDPLSVVKGMVSAVRPGGRIVLEDDGHDILRIWPEPQGFTRLWQSYIRTYDRAGNDPFVGHRLVQLLHQAGAVPSRNTWQFFGACAGSTDFPAYVDNLARIIEGVRKEILEIGELDSSSFDECIAAIRRFGDRPDAALWYAVSWAEGNRP